MTILEQKIIEYLTDFYGRPPTSQELEDEKSASGFYAVQTNTNNSQSIFAISPVDDIQLNLNLLENAGGGTLYLNPGTYVLTGDIYIPSSVLLEGASRDNVIIDCDGNYSVNIQNSGTAYNAGDISVSNNSLNVTGVGTTFTSNMEGKYIFLKNLWYEIDVVNSTTDLDLVSPYLGPNLTNDTNFVITVPNFNGGISKVTIQNGAGIANGLNIINTSEAIVNDILVQNCLIGINMNHCVYLRINCSVFECNDNIKGDNIWGFKIDFSDSSYSTNGSGYNLYLENSGQATIIDSLFSGATYQAIKFLNCEDITIISVDISKNDLAFALDGCSSIIINSVNIDSNNGTGIQFQNSAVNCVVTACIIKNNFGDGIIISSSGVNNSISSSIFENNGGGVVDNGTGTLIRSNIGVADN